MKGTLISSDFVKDSSGNYRFIEMNTDTGFTSNFIDNYLDLDPFINFISSSTPQVTTVEVVYKPLVCENFVEHLSASLAVSASFITDFVKHPEDLDTIYPMTPDDSDTKFILRLAYDENAILDSTYAKKTVEPLKLFNDNTSSNAIGFFYAENKDNWSSRVDSIDKTTNGDLFPDFVYKSNTNPQQSIRFIKINSGSNELNQIESFLSESHGSVVTKYYPSTGSAQSVKSYSIVYGTDLSSMHLGSYSIGSTFAFPTSSLSLTPFGTSSYSALSDKHYLQFSNSTRKELQPQHGLFETETLLSQSGDLLSMETISVGDIMSSYHIAGLPDTDNENVYREWSITGYEFASGSEPTSSVVNSIYTASLHANELVQIKINGDDEYRYISNNLNVLVYDTGSNITEFVSAANINSSKHFFINSSGSLLSLDESNIIVLNQSTGSVYSVDVETSDLVLSDGNTLGASFIFHNFTFPQPVTCFAAGTQVSLSNGDTKNIEDIVVGDEVLGWNGESLEPAFVTAIDHRHNVSSHAEACKSLGDEPSLYTINDTGLEFTPEHPFLTKEGWKSLVPNPNDAPYKTEQEPMVLQVGDSILRNGEWEEIDTIGIVRSIPEERVYNITVKGLHSYVVNGVVCHNKESGVT